jgi:hypothetical protein
VVKYLKNPNAGKKDMVLIMDHLRNGVDALIVEKVIQKHINVRVATNG